MDMKLFRGFAQGRQDTQQRPDTPGVENFRKHVIARRRVAKMSAHELLNWADVAGSGMAKGFDDYRKEGNPDSLLEIRDALVALTEVTEELIIREEVEHQQM